LACEALITAFSHNYNLNAWVFRFANIVGAHSTHGAIHDFIHRIKKGETVLNVLGNGRQKKSYLHVQECIDGMIYGYKNAKLTPEAIAMTDTHVQIFNLASQGVTEVRFMAEEVVRQSKPGLPIQYGTENRGWRGDVAFTWLDGSAFHKLGWAPKSNSDESVKRAISDIRKELL
jgi:UDP-glucose 4-epimerase